MGGRWNGWRRLARIAMSGWYGCAPSRGSTSYAAYDKPPACPISKPEACPTYGVHTIPVAASDHRCGRASGSDEWAEPAFTQGGRFIQATVTLEVALTN